jgi:hypothetical protein
MEKLLVFTFAFAVAQERSCSCAKARALFLGILNIIPDYYSYLLYNFIYTI